MSKILHKTLFTFFIVSFGILGSGAAHAGHWTIGGILGQSNFEDINDACLTSRCEIDDSDTSFGINAGYQFSEAWGLELGHLDLGTISLKESIFGFSIGVNGDVSATYLAGRGTYKFNDQWSLTGRLGAAVVDGTASTDLLPISIDVDAETVYGGLSIDYHIANNIKTGVRFDRVGNVSSVIALGLEFSFGK